MPVGKYCIVNPLAADPTSQSLSEIDVVAGINKRKGYITLEAIPNPGSDDDDDGEENYSKRKPAWVCLLAEI